MHEICYGYSDELTLQPEFNKPGIHPVTGEKPAVFVRRRVVHATIFMPAFQVTLIQEIMFFLEFTVADTYLQVSVLLQTSFSDYFCSFRETSCQKPKATLGLHSSLHVSKKLTHARKRNQ